MLQWDNCQHGLLKRHTHKEMGRTALGATLSHRIILETHMAICHPGLVGEGLWPEAGNVSPACTQSDKHWGIYGRSSIFWQPCDNQKPTFFCILCMLWP